MQTLPPPLLDPILDVLAQLARHYGVSVVFCTATQPALSGSRYLRGLGDVPEIVPSPELHFRALRRVRYELPTTSGLWSWQPLMQDAIARSDWDDLGSPIAVMCLIAILVGAGLVLLLQRQRRDLGIYCLTLIAPTLLFAHWEQWPRHSVLAFPAFMLLAERFRRWPRMVLLVAFGVLQVVFALQVTHTITRELPPGWSGFRRRIDRAMLGEVAWPPHERPRVYVCGPTPLVESVATALTDLGHDPVLIRTERFGPTGSP